MDLYVVIMNLSSSSYQNGINSEPFQVHCTKHMEQFITMQWVKYRNQSLNGMVLPVAVAAYCRTKFSLSIKVKQFKN